MTDPISTSPLFPWPKLPDDLDWPPKPSPRVGWPDEQYGDADGDGLRFVKWPVWPLQFRPLQPINRRQLRKRLKLRFAR